MGSIIESVYIEKFRAFRDQTIKFNRPVNAIIGRNGTMKTTLLGILAQPFSLTTGKMSDAIPLVGGKNFNSPMRDKFKFSDVYDIPGDHQWTLSINKKVYPKGNYTCVSELRKDNNKLRFWSTEGREKGMNFIQCPVIYLSMKRLSPLGEEKKLEVKSSELTEDEKRLYVSLHNRILISTDSIKGISSVESSSIRTIGPETEYSDAWTMSAGQDNVGRIILAIISMKRLMEEYPSDYSGGIIFIDEIESTLYPAAQEKMIELLFECAEEYKLQFFFTTHSMTVINYLKTGKHSNRASVSYLQKYGGQVHVTENPNLRDIESDLNLAAGKKESSRKIKVYCEDSVAIMIAKSIIPSGIQKKVSFVTGMSLSSTMYKTLYKHHVPEFLNNIILLDGDIDGDKPAWKDYPKNKNIIKLPMTEAPERGLYKTIYNLKDDDPYWDNTVGGYHRDACFRDYPDYLEDIEQIKGWFDAQKPFAGRGYRKMIGKWKSINEESIQCFIQDFIKTYNYVARIIGSEIIRIKEIQ